MRNLRGPISICLLALSSFAGCTKGEAELIAEDRAALDGVLAHDVRASQAMKDADDAARKGDLAAAVRVVETRATPAVDDGLRAAEDSSPKTGWGRAKRDEVTAVLRDRKGAMPGYVAALRADDPEKLLAAIEIQMAIERRAVSTVAAVKEGR